jgi:amidohydrolase
MAVKAYLSEAQKLFGYTREMRRDFHRHPELGFQEERTAGIVSRELAEAGLIVKTGIGKTGVVGMLEGGKSGSIVLLRFDMDALPVQEATGVAYASQTPGLMHACGHDGHMAIGLTVARILSGQRNELAGKYKFVFQPAEEGIGGAERMIADGVLTNPVPDYTLALHLWNERPVGWLALVPGPFMAGADFFDIRLQGKGGHGALPHETIDPIVAAAQVVTVLQSVVARNVSPLESAVVSVTSVTAGDAYNVTPPSAILKGTVRSFEPAVREKVLERVHDAAMGVGQAMGCRVEIDFNQGSPAVINDAGVTGRLQKIAGSVLPGIKVDPSFRTMVSEDMALMMEVIPGCYFMVGSSNAERGLDAGHHSPRFNFDEAVLPSAVAFMAAAAVELAGG